MTPDDRTCIDGPPNCPITQRHLHDPTSPTGIWYSQGSMTPTGSMWSSEPHSNPAEESKDE